MLFSFLYSDIRWSHPEAQPNYLEIYSVNDNSDSRQVKIKSRQVGLIEHLMQKLKDLHQYDDRQVNLVFGTSGRRWMDCDFSVVGMVVGVHLAHMFVGDWMIIYVIFLKTLRNFMCDWMWESVFVIFIQYVLFIKMLLHTEICLFLESVG